VRVQDPSGVLECGRFQWGIVRKGMMRARDDAKELAADRLIANLLLGGIVGKISHHKVGVAFDQAIDEGIAWIASQLHGQHGSTPLHLRDSVSYDFR
jgi:hypothetical protein